MDSVDFKALKEQVKIEQVVYLYKLPLRGRGSQLRGQCTCGGDPRALAVNTDKQSAYCFNTRKGGDLIWLASHVLGKTQKDAALDIASKLRVDTSSTVPPSPTPDIALLSSLKERLESKASSDQPAYLEAAILTEELIAKLGELR